VIINLTVLKQGTFLVKIHY